MPGRELKYRVCTRTAGLGSLGHMRLVAIANYHGGQIAREAKALAPSAVYWASRSKSPGDINYQAIITQAVRCPDPFVKLRGHWVVRRLAPYCSRIELTVLPKQRDECRLLIAMGWETTNIHLGSSKATKAVRSHFKKLKANWLFTAAKDMADAVERDWRVWCKGARP